jgi:hypothetical protein
MDYSYSHGTHLLRPRNINQGNQSLIFAYEQANAVCGKLPGVATAGCANPIYAGAGGPLAGLWDALGGNAASSLAPLGQLLFNQFRATGPNYAWAQTVSGGALSKPVLDGLLNAFGLPHSQDYSYVPFFSVKEYESSGSSLYHGMTMSLRKRFSRNYQLLASWTWSPAIDDSTDMQTIQEPQDNANSRLERGNSNFDQRHRFIVSGIWQSPRSSHALWRDWMVAPILEISSGRPYNLLTFNDRTWVNSSETARPSMVSLGSSDSFPSPDGRVGLALPPFGQVGNLGRNVYRTGFYASIDLRVMRHLRLREGRGIDLSVDGFNLSNHFNVKEVSNSFTESGRPVAAFPTRQIQFGVKLIF